MAQLDGLRGLAVLAVVIHHYLESFYRIHSARAFAFGGVSLFFVLSGFLITGILLRSRAMIQAGETSVAESLKIFYIRRALRIFPLYYAVIGCAVVVNLPPAREILAWLLTYTVNFRIVAYSEWVSYFSHFWTLCVEEQFYLFWPLLIFLVPGRALLPTVFAVAAIPLIIKAWWLFDTRLFTTAESAAVDWSYRTWIPFWMNLDSLGLGAALATCANIPGRPAQLKRVLTRYLLPFGLVVYALPFVVRGVPRPFIFVSNSTSLALVFCWLVYGAAQGFRGPAGMLLEWRPLQFLGKISYGVYVYHIFTLPVIAFLLKPFAIKLSRLGLAGALGSAALTLLIAGVSWRYLESPINRLKSRFQPRKFHGA